MRMNNRYDEIINLPHHVSKTRPQMPMSDRAAQFAPFAALTGYESAIKETGRLTDEKIELDEESLTALDMKYQLLMEALDDAPEVIAYILDPQKTDDAFYVSSYGCAASDAAAKEFEWTRNLAVQQGMQMPKVLARHLIQSFDIGEVTPEEAHEVGKQLADEWLKGKYEYVIATHIDKGHCHNHII